MKKKKGKKEKFRRYQAAGHEIARISDMRTETSRFSFEYKQAV